MILVILEGIAISAAFEPGNPLSLLLYLTIPLLIYAAGFIANLYAVKLERKIIALLDENCNPKDYIAFYRKALTKKALGKARMYELRNYILLNLSTGYLSSGDAEECKRVLDMVTRFSSTKNGAQNSVCFFNNLAAYFIRVNELEYAENTLKNMKEAMKNPKLNKKIYEIYDQSYNNKNVLLQVKRGNYDGAEDHLHMRFEQEKTRLGKVSTKYHLGDLYIRLGEHEKAALAFEYVLQNGNETYYAKKASEYLGKPLVIAQPPVKP